MQIVNFFYELARQHKRIKGFNYDKSYDKGAGNDAYPLVWLDDPIYGQSVGTNVVQYTCNVDFLGLPKDEAEVPTVQAEAFLVGLTFAEKIKLIRNVTGFSVERFNFISLRDYYDDNAAGFRFTFTINQANPVDRCAEDFDPEKQFNKIDALPDFKTDNPDGCAVFSDKKGLPNFKV